MSLLANGDIYYLIIQLCDLKSIINLLLLNKESYDFIIDLSFYKNLLKIKNCQNKRKEIFVKGYLNIIKILFNNEERKKSYQKEIKWTMINNHSSVLELLVEFWVTTMSHWDIIRIITKIASRGHTNMLEWLKNNVVPSSQNKNETMLFLSYSYHSRNSFFYYFLSKSHKMHDSLSQNNVKNSRLLFFEQQNGKAIMMASKNGQIAVLEWFKKNLCFEFKYNENAIDLASQNGQIAVLEWFKNCGFDFDYTFAIDYASENGHLHILKWFKKNSKRSCIALATQDLSLNPESQNDSGFSGFIFKYSFLAIDEASRNGHIHILKWFKNSGFELIYSHKAIDEASRNGHLYILKWFRKLSLESNSFHKFNYCHLAIDNASANGHLHILKWFKKSGYQFIYSNRAIDEASSNGHVNILEWWKCNSQSNISSETQKTKSQNLELKYSEKAIDNASANGHLHILKWFQSSGLKIKYSASAINMASANGHIFILEWFINSGLNLKYSHNAIDLAFHYERIDVLIWWKKSQLRLEYSEKHIEKSIKNSTNSDILREYFHQIKGQNKINRVINQKINRIS